LECIQKPTQDTLLHLLYGFFCFITNKNAKEKINPEDLPQNTLVIYPVHEDFSYILQTNIFKEEKEGSEEKIILYLESKKRRTYNN